MTGAGEPAGAPLVELVGITKRFGALVANDGIDLAIHGGQIHAVLGENGAGKSTLMRVLYGLTQPDAGEIRVGGKTMTFASPKDARRAGIGIVTQEFSLVGPITATDNVVLAGAPLGPLDRRAARASVVAATERIGITVDPDATVESLSVGERQRVEILKALYHRCRVLVLDEPTAVLVPQDVEALFAALRRLTAEGIGVVLISHKLREVVANADTVTVLRRGRLVTTQPALGLDPPHLAALMVGATAPVAEEADVSAAVGLSLEVVEQVGAATVATAAGSPALEIRDLTVDTDGVQALYGLSLTVHRGEIVGVAGVSGNGQTELMAVLCGTASPTAGTVTVDGTDVTDLDPLGRIRAGLGRLTEDRRGSVVPSLSVAQNLVLEDLERFRRHGFLRRRAVDQHARRLIADYDIRAEPDDAVATLSGGNVQKVLLARALSREPIALVAAQPTRGLDVGACAYVHAQLRAVRERGGGVLLISEDLDELFVLADRFVVLYSGRIAGEVSAADATPELLGLLMTGHSIEPEPAR